MPPFARVVRRILVGAFLLPLAAGAAHAQTASPRTSVPPDARTEPSLRAALSHLATKHGVWASLGASRGGADLFCEVCTQDPTYAWALHATAGMRLTPTLLVGVETLGWYDVFGDANRTARSTTIQLRHYGFGRTRPYLQAGAGIASYRVRDGDAGFRTQSPALVAGVGYDWRVGSVTLNPSLSAVASVGGQLRSDRTANAIDPNARLVLLRTGLALSWFR